MVVLRAEYERVLSKGNVEGVLSLSQRGIWSSDLSYWLELFGCVSRILLLRVESIGNSSLHKFMLELLNS